MNESEKTGTGPEAATSAPAVAAKPAGLRVTRATAADADILCEMIRELATFEKLESECAITEDAVLAHLIGQNRSADALVAWFEDAPAGFAVYYRTFSTFAARPGIHVEDLYVRPRYRRLGFGRALLATIGRLACHLEAGRMEWTALKWNTNARHLYASIGAREMDEWLLLRLDGSALRGFGCGSPGHPHAGCRCGGTGLHHQRLERSNAD